MIFERLFQRSAVVVTCIKLPIAEFLRGNALADPRADCSADLPEHVAGIPHAVRPLQERQH